MSLAAEDRRCGPFELLTRVAKGGMADIYLARQSGIAGFERIVVVKKILSRLADEPEFVAMFLDEARLAALINHPNVVQIYDVGVAGGEYFIAMELVHGVTVASVNRDARRQGKPVSVAAALEIAAQTCDGLAAAHGQRDLSGAPLGLVHRDVTPQNLMIAHRGIVKILDFGIAKATRGTSRTRLGHLKGKLAYMSPEQARSEPLDGRSDLFSLGTVLYELLTGQNPFSGKDDVETLQNVALRDPPPPSAVRQDLPPAVDALVLRALARDRNERFETAGQLGRSTREVLGELGRRSATDILEAELSERFDALLAAQQLAIDEAVSVSRTAPGRTPPGGGTTRASEEAETQVAQARPVADRPQPSGRRLVRWGVVAALAVVLSGGAALVVGQQREGSGSSPGRLALDARRPLPEKTEGARPRPSDESAARQVAGAPATTPPPGPTAPAPGSPRPAERSRPAAPSRLAEVQVTSEPSGAVVRAGGLTFGQTPIAIFLPTARRSAVTFRLDGHEPQTVFWSGPDGRRSIHVSLRPAVPQR